MVKTLDSTFSEFGLIDFLDSKFSTSLPGFVKGIGDDCAVIGPRDDREGSYLVISVDTMVEEKHFSLKYFSSFELGIKLINSTVSDISAMGSVPKYGLLSLSIPENRIDFNFIKGLRDSINLRARELGLFIIGGDTTSSKELFLSLTVIGESKWKPVLRSTAEVGDDVWVSGEIGLSFLGLNLLQNRDKRGQISKKNKSRAIKRHLEGAERVRVGSYLASNNLVNSMIDISDGLIQDLNHIVESSKIDIELEVSKIPISDEVNKHFSNPLVSLTGGEDYELLFTAKKENRGKIYELASRDLNFTRIAKVKESKNHIKPSLYVVEREKDKRECVEKFFRRKGFKTLGYVHF